VRRPNEVHHEGSRETGRAFIIPASSKPFMVMRTNYFDQWKATKIYDSLEFIAEWEVKHGTRI
jgi:hypothetical protein